MEWVTDRSEGTPFTPDEKVGARLATLASDGDVIVRTLCDSLAFRAAAMPATHAKVPGDASAPS